MIRCILSEHTGYQRPIQSEARASPRHEGRAAQWIWAKDFHLNLAALDCEGFCGLRCCQHFFLLMLRVVDQKSGKHRSAEKEPLKFAPCLRTVVDFVFSSELF